MSTALIPRPHQIEAATKFDNAIWNEEGSALLVAPVATGKTLILIMVAVAAVERGCARIVDVSRSRHVAKQSLDTLKAYRPDISGGFYTGKKKQAAQILFATAPTLARHIEIVEAADLVLIDECDQAYLRDETKEYAAILKAARRYAGCTGTPFVLEKGRTVPIFGPGKIFNKPCSLVTKADLRDAGFFHFIERTPITPSRQLKIERKTKIDISGDFDTKVQACSVPMLSAIAEDTKAAVVLLGQDQQFLFFGSTTAQCDAQVAAYKNVGLNVEPYHNGVSSWQQKDIMARFRAGEIQGLATVQKVNRAFDCPAVSLVVIGFGTASRSKYEQMCGRAQRSLKGKTAAWVLDYGGHGQRFGSANWDWPEAIEFDRREKLRVPAEELANTIRAGHRDPKCETRPDNFLDLFEATVDLFDVVLKPARSGRGVHIHYIHSLGYTVQTLHPGNGWTARVLRLLGTPRFQGEWANPPTNYEELVCDITAADLPSHVMLRRVFDTFWNKITIAVVGYARDDAECPGDGVECVFDDKPVVSQEWLRQRAQDRMAGYDEGGAREPRGGTHPGGPTDRPDGLRESKVHS